ncbi:MAG TPA: hypothetical protein VKA35_01045 [Solirubrobacterales bacterium]|nr:hypothetical protein [Solirubrobacterales bacterium]
MTMMLAVVLLLGLVLSAQASASQVLRFKEAFGSAAQPTFVNPTGMAVDQSTGDLFVMDRGSGTISRFNPDGSPDDFSALGTNVIDGESGPDETPQGEAAEPGLTFAAATEAQIVVDNSGGVTDGDIYVTQQSPNVIDIFASSGEYLGQLTESESDPFSEACGVTVGPAGDVFVGDYLGGSLEERIREFSPTANPPTNADFLTSLTNPEKPCSLAAGSGPTATSLFALDFEGDLFKQSATTGKIAYPVSEGAGSTTTVDAETGNVLLAEGSEVIEYDASGPSEAVEISKLSLASKVQGIAVGPAGLVYVSREGAQGIEEGAQGIEVLDHVPIPAVTVNAATNIAPTGATLNGSVNPEGVVVSECKFEYGLTTSSAFSDEAPCSPAAADIVADTGNHNVSAAITGLQPNATYRFRLIATNANGAATSKVGTFTTPGPPRFSEIRARDADQTSATLEAKINPSGFGTSYHFEWGPSTAYGHRVPVDFEPFVGSGTEPVLVTARISGLSAASTYHYRLVATSTAGTTNSPDQKVQTLNSCGLPDQRCLELVSPREAGPVALSGASLTEELDFQAAAEPGSLVYSVSNGLPGTTKGGVVLYRAGRGASGWSSSQFSPPNTVRNETSEVISWSSTTLGISADLSCGFVESNQPLTSDFSTRLAVEAGGTNLYRRNLDGSYTAISKLVPENFPEGGFGRYLVSGFSDDCEKVVFQSQYRYPGVPAIEDLLSGDRLYEWDEGTLRSVGMVPGPSGEIAVGAAPAGFPGTNVVSEDGTRVFFSAERQIGANPEEVGKTGIFVREDGTTTRDLSQSETAIPDTGASYQYATPDGSRVFFIANAGLTVESSPEGTDLYEYNLESDDLTDLSVDPGNGGAQVGRFIGSSTDGSHVYFGARGQLIPGKGKTLVENQQAHTYSIYGAENGVVSYVGVLSADLLPQRESFQVSPDGRYILFESDANVTGYVSGGVQEAYLYDAEAKTEGTVCVSCRQDGKASVSPRNNRPLGFIDFYNPFHPKMRLVEHDGQPLVFFTSIDRLASGSRAGDTNLYEWAHGQVLHIATEPPIPHYPEEEGSRQHEYIRFVGASADGTDLYFTTSGSLTWENQGGRQSVYDARIGGGFPEPPASPAPCNPDTPGSCRAPSAPPLSPAAPATSTFTGPGNAKQKKRHKKHKPKKHHKKHKQSKKQAQARDANNDRRAGK